MYSTQLTSLISLGPQAAQAKILYIKFLIKIVGNVDYLLYQERIYNYCLSEHLRYKCHLLIKSSKMEEVTRNAKSLKEVKSAKRAVETAVKLFGPTNVTSILDRETFGDKLATITTKLETYLEKSEEVIEELEELRESETETECDKTIEEINTLTDAIIQKVNDNEHAVKKKIEEVVREYEDNRDEKTTSDKFDAPSITNSATEKATDHPILSDKIADNKEVFDEEIPSGSAAATDLINLIKASVPANEKSEKGIKQVSDVVEALPAVNQANIGQVVNSVLPVVNDVINVFRLFHK